MMRPVIAIALVLRGIDILTMFASVHIITQGTPGGDTETMSYFIYRTGLQELRIRLCLGRLGHRAGRSPSILAQSFVRRFFKSGRD